MIGYLGSLQKRAEADFDTQIFRAQAQQEAKELREEQEKFAKQQKMNESIRKHRHETVRQAVKRFTGQSDLHHCRRNVAKQNATSKSEKTWKCGERKRKPINCFFSIKRRRIDNVNRMPKPSLDTIWNKQWVHSRLRRAVDVAFSLARTQGSFSSAESQWFWRGAARQAY